MRVLLVVMLAACEIQGSPTTVDIGTFPYHPLVYELDLAILAYQLHGQSFVWPIDPFYEEHADSRGTGRDTFMGLVRDWAAREGTRQIAAATGLDGYRGPGVLAGLPNNPTHDPILYDYARIHPWSPAITNNEDQWTEYVAPDEITKRIREVYVSARPIGGDGSTVALTQVAPGRDDFDADASNTLCAFEGGTGDKGELDQPASFSLMGFALARDRGDGGYDVHIAFRGSRSGSAARAVTDALSTSLAKGNPDWVTDLGWALISASDVSTVGGVHRGFAHAMQVILPGAVQCLAKLADLRGAPVNIYVTGHSLGGGLAQQFASAVLLGDQLGPDGQGPAMPAALQRWPWQQLKLVTWSAPRAGDFTWARELSKRALDSGVYDPGPIETVDADARVILDPGIVVRLLDPAQPSAFRLLISTDPITTTHITDGTHVGTTVYVNGRSFLDWLGIVSSDDHEPINVRKDMISAFADARIPTEAWRYHPISDFVPDRDESEKGTPLEMQKLAAGLLAYYADRGLYFDATAFSRDLELMFAIERGTAP